MRFVSNAGNDRLLLPPSPASQAEVTRHPDPLGLLGGASDRSRRNKLTSALAEERQRLVASL